MAEVHLPPPDEVGPDGSAWWWDSNGEQVFAVDGAVYAPEHGTDKPLGAVEMDAAVRLAAVRHAQDQAANGAGRAPDG